MTESLFDRIKKSMGVDDKAYLPGSHPGRFVHGNYVFGATRQLFVNGQRVVLGRTGDDVLDGMTGTVIGRMNTDVHTYIVRLDELYNGWDAINLTECCLCPI